ncbi:hypothetical protein [Leucobacter sp. USHLN154]|uniref:hypothetical protein n=1 Tax=Leucobacter sp. USHLN154 TaxID=3081269 RepID=UPI00301AD8EF
MKNSFTKVAAGAALAGAALLTLPTIANATDYPDQVTSSVSQTAGLQPGDTVSISVSGLTPNEGVQVSLNGANADGGGIAQAMLFKSADTLGQTLLADASGSLNMNVTLPANGYCDYNVNAAQGAWAKTWTLSLPGDCGAGAGAAAAANGAGDGGLAVTGGDQSFLWAGIGAGALALVGGGLVAASAARKKRNV